MPNPTPRFWATPLRYMRWSMREKPALFYSVAAASTFPITLFGVPPVLKKMGYERAPPIPMTYPVPTGPRKQLTGYDD
ncbi:hypothetical protein F5X98DRAFT_376441 [Xylaria grammica]|nr:hypothetical protein F5X98DRAFT_376441 [Xylaria grammica]